MRVSFKTQFLLIDLYTIKIYEQLGGIQMKQANRSLKRVKTRLNKLTIELKEVKKNFNFYLNEYLTHFKEEKEYDKLILIFNELINDVFIDKISLNEQVFLLTLKFCIININDKEEKERIINLSRQLLGFDKLKNKPLHPSLREYRDYLFYILNLKLNVPVEELSRIVHISSYSIKRSIEYRSARGFRSIF